MPKEEKSRIRVFFADFEGSDSTIKEGLKAIADAVEKTFEAKTKFISITPPSKDGTIQAITETINDESIIDTGIEEPKTTSSRKSKGSSKAPKLNMVSNLNLFQKGKKSLREFFAEKNPKEDQQKIVVFLYYLTKTLKLQNIGPDHIYTCFKDIGEKIPSNLYQSLRNIKKRRRWIDFSTLKDLQLTVHGENLVEQKLSKKGKEEEN